MFVIKGFVTRFQRPPSASTSHQPLTPLLPKMLPSPVTVSTAANPPPVDLPLTVAKPNVDPLSASLPNSANLPAEHSTSIPKAVEKPPVASEIIAVESSTEQPLLPVATASVTMSCASSAPTILDRQTARVRPRILTHVIEGFVIQEASEPFPVRNA